MELFISKCFLCFAVPSQKYSLFDGLLKCFKSCRKALSFLATFDHFTLSPREVFLKLFTSPCLLCFAALSKNLSLSTVCWNAFWTFKTALSFSAIFDHFLLYYKNKFSCSYLPHNIVVLCSSFANFSIFPGLLKWFENCQNINLVFS